MLIYVNDIEKNLKKIFNLYYFNANFMINYVKNIENFF